MHGPEEFSQLLAGNRMVPVVTVATVDQAVAVGHALLAGGISVIEVTLRTAAGLDAIRALSTECPDLVVGAGTVLDRRQAEASLNAGARFLVSPGHTARLIETAKALQAPWMLGATSLSEVMHLREHGFRVQKFFPAEPMGGTATLKGIGSVLPDVRFCPTGGISAATAKRYLDLPNVMAIGGSWFMPSGGFESETVTTLAREAVALLAGAGQARPA